MAFLRSRGNSNPDSAGRVAILRTRKLGDTIAMTPAIEAAAQAGYEVAFVCNPAFRSLFERTPFPLQLETAGRRLRISEGVRIGLRLRRWGCDYFVCQQDIRSGVAAAGVMSGARVRVGWTARKRMGNWPSRFFTQQAVKEDMLPIHIVEANLDVLSSALNHELGSGPLRCWADPSRVERESEAILPREPYLVLHLGTGGSNPPLPPTAYAAIAEGLSRRSGLRLVITGDSKLAETLEGSNHLSLAGTTSLLGLAGVLQHAKALVSVDSGPVHLAASLHTPIVVVYAKKVATPRRYHPWQATYSAIRAEAFCEGCTEAACQSQRTWTCADSVDPEKVVAAALTLLHTERLPDISAASIAEQRSDKSA